jgi:alcohol dehydrogenase (cytochrome c)
MLATGGGLVFTGGTSDGNVHAFDAASGKLLWEFTTNSGVIAPPSSFSVGGKQYIAVLSGWAGDARGMANQVARYFPGGPELAPEGGAVWVFAVE